MLPIWVTLNFKITGVVGGMHMVTKDGTHSSKDAVKLPTNDFPIKKIFN